VKEVEEPKEGEGAPKEKSEKKKREPAVVNSRAAGLGAVSDVKRDVRWNECLFCVRFTMNCVSPRQLLYSQIIVVRSKTTGGLLLS
jgi:hypothetical protein